ncbi:hypothetical protein NDA17_005760 [Ustilago hordei]|nr:hypothetical protein NDA17_005760 [Ustilago hordei]
MYLLGVHLADHKLVRIALTNFYGISYDTANRLCARLSLHDRATVASLTESQITQLSAYLSSPGSIPARKPQPTTTTSQLLNPTPSSSASSKATASTSADETSVGRPSMEANSNNDPLRQIKIEADLKRVLHANINHHRNVGSYRGRRHASHLPVRGQKDKYKRSYCQEVESVREERVRNPSYWDAVEVRGFVAAIIGAFG